jgi:hypothetical protein
MVSSFAFCYCIKHCQARCASLAKPSHLVAQVTFHSDFRVHLRDRKKLPVAVLGSKRRRDVRWHNCKTLWNPFQEVYKTRSHVCSFLLKHLPARYAPLHITVTFVTSVPLIGCLSGTAAVNFQNAGMLMCLDGLYLHVHQHVTDNTPR